MGQPQGHAFVQTVAPPRSVVPSGASCGSGLAGPTISSTNASLSISANSPIVWSGAVILIGGALAALGSFLPWITATAAFVGTINRNGLDGGGDGLITIALGIVIILLGVALLARSGNPRTARIGAAICGLALGWVAVADINSINERIRSLNSTLAAASVGMGIIVIAFAAVLVLVGAFLPSAFGARATLGPSDGQPLLGGPARLKVNAAVLSVRQALTAPRFGRALHTGQGSFGTRSRRHCAGRRCSRGLLPSRRSVWPVLSCTNLVQREYACSLGGRRGEWIDTAG